MRSDDLHDRRAGDLVAQGDCSPSCLLALGEEIAKCSCRCGGKYHGALADVSVPDNAPWWCRCSQGGWSDDLLASLPVARPIRLHSAETNSAGWCGIEKRGNHAYAVIADVHRSNYWPDHEATLMNRFTMALLKNGRAQNTGLLPASWFSVGGLRNLVEARMVLAVLTELWHGNPCAAVRAIEVLEGRPDPVALGYDPQIGYPDRLVASFEPPKTLRL